MCCRLQYLTQSLASSLNFCVSNSRSYNSMRQNWFLSLKCLLEFIIDLGWFFFDVILVKILEINFKNVNLGAKINWKSMFVPLMASKVYHQLIHHIILKRLTENVGAHDICLSNCFLSFSSTAFIQNFLKNVTHWEILKPFFFFKFWALEAEIKWQNMLKN